MNAINYIKTWMAAKGYSFCYGNGTHVEEWMGRTDFAASLDDVATYAYLLTASSYEDQKDRYDVGIFFATLIPFDFDNQNIDTVTEDLKERSKELLNDIAAGNEWTWSGARWQYGYDDYAENVCWVCLRVTLTALSADCVPMPMPEPPTLEMTPLPDVAAAFLSLYGYSNTVERGGLIASGHEGDMLYMAFIGVTPEYSGDNVDTYVTINGDRAHYGSILPDIITEETVEYFPQLAPYIGQMVWPVILIESEHPENSFCVEIEFEDFWTSPEVCWEEVP